MPDEKLSVLYHSTFQRLKELSTAMSEAGMLEKDKPHVAIYTDALRELRRKTNNDRAAEAVLIELAAHADETGKCWPGAQRLGELCGYHPRTVQNALETLMALDYVRVASWYNPRKRTVERDYLCNPSVIYLRSELREVALQAYECGSNSLDSLTNDIQPNRTTTNEPTKKNQHHEPTPPPPRNGATSAPTGATSKKTMRKAVTEPKTPKNQEQISGDQPQSPIPPNGEQSEPESPKTPIPGSGAPLPPHPVPLGFDPSVELLPGELAAGRLKELSSRMSLKHARTLVAAYGDDVVTMAQAYKADTSLRNWIGALNTDLALKRACPDDYLSDFQLMQRQADNTPSAADDTQISPFPLPPGESE